MSFADDFSPGGIHDDSHLRERLAEHDDSYKIICANCGDDISDEEYDRTGTDEYCESCPEMCCDPRSKTFGCECDDGA